MDLRVTYREANADAWAQGEHPCQKSGHSYGQSTETGEATACRTCGADPEAEDTADDEREGAVDALHGYLGSVVERDVCESALDALTTAGYVVVRKPW